MTLRGGLTRVPNAPIFTGSGLQVNIVEFKERRDKKDFVGVHIIVERDAHRGILIGKGGSALKQLATSARLDIEDFLQRPVSAMARRAWGTSCLPIWKGIGVRDDVAEG